MVQLWSCSRTGLPLPIYSQHSYTPLTTLQTHTSESILHSLAKTSRTSCNSAVWWRAKTQILPSESHRTSVALKSSDQYISLSQKGAVLTTTAFPHFFVGEVGWCLQSRAQVLLSTIKFLPNSAFGEDSS